MVLCWKVAKTIGLVDLNTYNYVNMSSIQYQHYEKDMQLLPLNIYRREFEVLDANPCDKKKFHK